MSDHPKILAFAGSLRKDSLNKKVLNVAAQSARAAGAEVTVIDLFDYDMPLYNADAHEATGFPPNAVKFQELLIANDGLLICSPEYNGSLPGGMKNALDWASRINGDQKMYAAFKNKIAGIMTASPGSFGGLRALGHLRGSLTIMTVEVLPLEIAVTFAAQKFEGDKITDESTKGLLEKLGSTLVEKVRRAQN